MKARGSSYLQYRHAKYYISHSFFIYVFKYFPKNIGNTIHGQWYILHNEIIYNLSCSRINIYFECKLYLCTHNIFYKETFKRDDQPVMTYKDPGFGGGDCTG